MAHIHILGICGTFMGGIAAIARQQGHQVTGSDRNVYPPMSTQLEQLGISICDGYADAPLRGGVDQIIVGNVMTRGMEATEYLLSNQTPYVSGPQWLGEQVLRNKTVYSVSGTHGKTTTSSMLAWILEDNGINPGFLIGGVCHHFDQSARITESEAFVIEADEYDSAFFDKRSKFVHYHSNVVIVNNLEYDHADIFEDLNAIKKQFHHLVRTIPKDGLLVVNHDDPNVQAVLEMGCWTPTVSFGRNDSADYWVKAVPDNTASFAIMHGSEEQARINWDIPGVHNQLNALAAMLAARAAGVNLAQSADSLSRFQNVKRRMECIGTAKGVTIYDDFAHHPTAIETTIRGAQVKHPGARVISVIEPRSNSMRSGAHAALLPQAVASADVCFMVYPEWNDWDQDALKALREQGVHQVRNTEVVLARLLDITRSGDVVVFMSNGGFNDVFHTFFEKLSFENI